jgi:hypothetical protein
MLDVQANIIKPVHNYNGLISMLIITQIKLLYY